MTRIVTYVKSHKKILLDFIYSFIAYALPTIVLQFAIQPLIAAKTTADENGLFISLFNVIKLLSSVLIIPLSNLRLLKKNDADKDEKLNSLFNFIFLVVTVVSLIIGLLAAGVYERFNFSLCEIITFLLALLLISVHDYLMISFRITLNYKKIVIDNSLIVLGYIIGAILFVSFGLWELIFIVGYLFALVFIFLNSTLWKDRPTFYKGKNIWNEYCGLSTSALLTNTPTYCDRIIIYPILGGFDVSVYNAAAVVSKAISIVSAPLRNVLLSYIVNVKELKIQRRKTRRAIPLFLVIVIAVIILFCGISIIVCNFLYPKYATEAIKYVPLIVSAIVIETCGSILNIVLLRFAKAKTQMFNSAIKLSIYIVAVVLLAIVLKLKLLGFCIAILLADIAYSLTVGIKVLKYIRTRRCK